MARKTVSLKTFNTFVIIMFVWILAIVGNFIWDIESKTEPPKLSKEFIAKNEAQIKREAILEKWDKVKMDLRFEVKADSVVYIYYLDERVRTIHLNKWTYYYVCGSDGSMKLDSTNSLNWGFTFYSD